MPSPPIKIIITTDLHGYISGEPGQGRPGLARLKTYLDSLSDNGYLTFLLDSGDAFSGSAGAQVDRGRFTAEVMGRVGYRVMTPGNHDFDHNEIEENPLYYSETLLPLTRESGSPSLAVTAVNLSRHGRDLPGTVRRPVVIYDQTAEDQEGLRLIVAGAAYPYTARPSLAPSIAGYEFGLKPSAEETSAALMSALNTQLLEYGRANDVVIVLSHLGFDNDRCPGRVSGPDLAAARNVDFIADGHSHKAVAPRRVDSAVYGNGGRYLENFLEITVEAGSRVMELKSCHDLAGLPPDPLIEAELTRFESAHGFHDLIFNLKDETFNGNNLRRASTPLGRLIGQAIAEAAGADLALQNAGTIRAGLGPGPVKAGMVYDTLPFNTNILTYALTGEEIYQLFKNFIKDGPERPQFYGFKVFAWAGESGSVEIAGLSDLDGRAVEPERTFTVAVSDFMRKGRGKFIFDGRKSDNHGDLTTAVIKRLKLMPNGPDTETLSRDNLLIFDSRQSAEEHFRAETQARGL